LIVAINNHDQNILTLASNWRRDGLAQAVVHRDVGSAGKMTANPSARPAAARRRSRVTKGSASNAYRLPTADDVEVFIEPLI
jgi:hypothetical protein